MSVTGNERGMVLLVVLILVGLLSALVIDQAHRQLIDLRLVETFRDSTRAYYLARGGLEAGASLVQMDKNSYDALDETWAQPIRNFAIGEGSVDLNISAQDGRIDLNRLVNNQGNIDVFHRDRLERLLTVLGVVEAEERVATLVDWLDPDDDLTPGGGTESAYYQSLTPPYPARNGPLESVQELSRLRGFDAEFVTLLRPHVTLYGNAAINLNTATREVILALHPDLTESDWELLKTRRDEGPLKRVEDVKEVSSQWETVHNSIRPQLTVVSDNYLLQSIGHVGRGVRRMEAYYRKSTRRLLAQRAY